MFRIFTLISLTALITLNINAGTVLESDWDDVARGKCSDQNTAWWSSDEAIRIANNVLLNQKNCGGWYKNIYELHYVLTEAEKTSLIAAKSTNTGCTIDNGAVLYELQYLSTVYGAISDDSIKAVIEEGFVKGVQYLLNAQYDNGGWPQFYPLKTGYYTHITYNDNAMQHAMQILQHLYLEDGTYNITLSDSMAVKAETAFNKGVECILNCQYIQNGKLTSWCAQHDENTLLPAKARDYELASLSGAESADVIYLLMTLDNPSSEVRSAIIAACEWYDDVKIEDRAKQYYSSTCEGEDVDDFIIVYKSGAADMWARFYRMEDNKPFFCDRDGIMKFDISEIGCERRTGYSWYGTAGTTVKSKYSSWLSQYGLTTLVNPVASNVYYTTDTIPVNAFANKYQGSTLDSFELYVDNLDTIHITSEELDTTLTGFEAGEYTFIAKAFYADGSTELDTNIITVEVETFSLNVKNGEGDGSYVEGETVTIVADDASDGKSFAGWKGDTAYVDDPFSASATVTMPAEDITITAVYKTGVENMQYNESLKCYPNPATDALTVELTGNVISQIRIFSASGSLINSANPLTTKAKVNTADFSSGIYLIHITDSDGNIYTRRIVKN